MKPCGCRCPCHTDETEDWWPGPCAGCCEPGDECACGRKLESYGLQRTIYPTEFTRPDYVIEESNG